jgi:hypothetical protein
MLRLAFSDLRDSRLRSIRFKTELTSPALCPFAAFEGLTIKATTKTARRITGETNLFITTPHNQIQKPFLYYSLIKLANYKD